MTRPTFLALLAALALAGAGTLASRQPGAEAALRDGGPNLAVVIQAGRYTVGPGQAVSLAAGFLNRGDRPLTVRLTCAPAADFEVRSADGATVWTQASPCNANEPLLTLQPGQQRLWEAQWPGSDVLGEYTAYAVLHTTPREAVAGPLTLTVTDVEPPTATEHPRETEVHATERPHETDMPRPSETPHATEVHATERPHETDMPHPTATPGVNFSDDIFPIANRDTTEREPDVDGRREAGDCQMLVVWLDEAAHGIMARFVEGSWRSEPFRVSGEDNPVGSAKVAYNATRHLWLVVWSARRDGDRTAIRARYVQCGGVEGDVFTVGASDENADAPAVAASGEAFGVSWITTNGERRVLRAAGVVGVETHWQVAVADGPVGANAVACRSNGACFIVWTSGNEGGQNILGRRWWLSQERVDKTWFEVATTDAAEDDPSIAAGDGDRDYLVTWTRAGDATRVWARRVHASGEMVNGDAFPVSGDGTANQGDVSPANDGFNVVWAARTGDMAVVRGRYVRVADAVQLGAIATISNPDAPTDVYPAAATVGSHTALAVWQAGGDDNGDILGRFVTWPGEGQSHVVVFARVSGAGTTVQAAGSLNVTIERLVDGVFTCQQARVTYGAETQLPPGLRVGDRLYIVAQPDPAGAPCTLDVSAPGTSITAVGQVRLFAPLVMKLK